MNNHKARSQFFVDIFNLCLKLLCDATSIALAAAANFVQGKYWSMVYGLIVDTTKLIIYVVQQIYLLLYTERIQR